MSEHPLPPPLPSNRPGWVWVISIFYVLTSMWGLLAQLLFVFGLKPGSPEQQALVNSLSTSSRILGVGITLLNLAAAVLLWMLRKVAFNLFITAFVLGIASQIWQAFPGGSLHKMFEMGPIMMAVTLCSVVIGLAISAAIYAYVWHLRREGVLR